MSDNNLRLCEPSTDLDDAWRKLYETAFPMKERETEARLKELIDSGKMLFHRTNKATGELLCFSMVSLASDFCLLAFIAVDSTQRSGGVGSKHVKRLLELLKEKYPKYLGLFLEIEDTAPKNLVLTDEEKKTRQRRFDFYKRLSATRVCKCFRYAIPSRANPGQELEMDLLYFNFTASPLDTDTKSHVVSEIYQSLYSLSGDDALVKKTLAELKSCAKPSCCGAKAEAQPCNVEVDKAEPVKTEPAKTAS
ncbi:MAG: hypothetical protein K2W82_15990 [Candidatus Obscuribacterales bacterium]|nr:hypothetical protein [Candidatus Obscuribacterales bacterium]